MKYLKTFNTKTNDYIYYVTLNEHCSFKLYYEFSNISSTYGGVDLMIDIDNIRGLLRQIPNFIEDFVWCDIDKSLKGFGFEKQTEATPLQQMMYLHGNPIKVL